VPTAEPVVSAAAPRAAQASDYREAQTRIIEAAVGLFGRHGVAGTSLQMIADAVGVTKAAVYHQFHSKDQIVLAAAEAELTRLEAVVVAAEAETSTKAARDTLLAGMVDLAIASRASAGPIIGDPVIVEFFSDHRQFRDVLHRIRRVLLGDDAGPTARVRTAMVIATISGAVLHPFVADIDDDTLRAELLQMARRFVGLRA
jgi:AcrR family transcriptional regulator